MSLTAQVSPAGAGQKFFRPARDAWQPEVPGPLNDLPDSVLYEIARNLDPVSCARFACTHKAGHEAANEVKKQAFKIEFAKMILLTIPEVTQADVAHLQQVGVETSIRAPLRSFKISDTPITIGLYHAVMGHYPDLSLSNWSHKPGESDALRARWEMNPDLPLTNTTVAEDQAFIAALNTRTGRHFRLPTESEVEYSIRGRIQGAITTTRYHFGNDGNEVCNRTWFNLNSGDQAHGVREPLPGRTLDDSRNSFGLIHSTGNVWNRSSEGVVRGGSFGSSAGYTQSFFRGGGYSEYRFANFGSRLVEDF